MVDFRSRLRRTTPCRPGRQMCCRGRIVEPGDLNSPTLRVGQTMNTQVRAAAKPPRFSDRASTALAADLPSPTTIGNQPHRLRLCGSSIEQANGQSEASPYPLQQHPAARPGGTSAVGPHGRPPSRPPCWASHRGANGHATLFHVKPAGAAALLGSDPGNSPPRPVATPPAPPPGQRAARQESGSPRTTTNGHRSVRSGARWPTG